ncbi:YggS family pyridoxal phosphate-dependent enzyme, partial [Candidatus Poribacteria bacterium]|nr:YggS family pyridoxal phosphate-dependent enzyme [Candidatus Poribacteria bacterium]
MNRIAENFAHVKHRIAEAAQKSGRSPASIQLVVVTKGASVADIEAVLKAGATI